MKNIPAKELELWMPGFDLEKMNPISTVNVPNRPLKYLRKTLIVAPAKEGWPQVNSGFTAPAWHVEVTVEAYIQLWDNPEYFTIVRRKQFRSFGTLKNVTDNTYDVQFTLHQYFLPEMIQTMYLFRVDDTVHPPFIVKEIYIPENNPIPINYLLNKDESK